MGHNLSLISTTDDYLGLLSFVESTGLVLVPIVASRLSELDRSNPGNDPLCFLSYLSPDQLHPSKKGWFLDVIDPIIEFRRPYYQPPILVAGRIYWNDDSEELGKLTKSYFQRIQRWVRKNWLLRPEDGFYAGPNAARLLGAGEAEVAYLPPGTTIRQASKRPDEA